MINKVTLIGNLGQDPEMRTFLNGSSVVSLSVATTESWKDRNSGEWRDKTEWHRVSCYIPALNDMLVRRYRKGDKVYIEGKLETRKWTAQDGSQRFTTEVALRPGATIKQVQPARGRTGAERVQENVEKQSMDEIPF